MRLSFSLPSPFSHDRLRALFEAMACVLTGQPIKLVRSDHHETHDPNHGAACFEARWSDGAVVLDQRVEATDGNPRDGYPYLHSAELTMPGRSLRASDSGGSPHFALLEVEVEPCSAPEWLTLRGLLRQELGAERDRCSRPYVTPGSSDARVDELEGVLKRLRHALAGQLDFEMWERWGASSATPAHAAQMHAQDAACKQEESEAKAALEALIIKARADAPGALDAWVAKHDAYLVEHLAACVARDDQLAAAGAKTERERWAELREGRRTFFQESASWPSDRDRYRRIFGMDP